MAISSEHREMLNDRRQEATRELAELSAARGVEDGLDKAERRQELLDELDEIRHDLGEVEPEE
jgi:hypothetical protein